MIKKLKIFKTIVIVIVIFFLIGYFLIEVRQKNQIMKKESDDKRMVKFYHDFNIKFPEIQIIESRLVHQNGQAYEAAQFSTGGELFLAFQKTSKITIK